MDGGSFECIEGVVVIVVVVVVVIIVSPIVRIAVFIGVGVCRYPILL